MTRCMAGPGLVPTEAMGEYYARRAAAGMIISEGTIVRPDAQGYPDVPGIFTEEQERGWRRVVEAVHSAGGRIVCQLWHVGRVSHPSYLGGASPVAPSAVGITGRIKRASGLEYGPPRALDASEIPELAADFGRAAERAMRAGFDGVEIHGANGYLIEQFMRAKSNLRDDTYGGSVSRRIRFPLDVLRDVLSAVGPGRAGIRLSPGAYHYADSDPSDPEAYAALLEELDASPVAYVHTGIFDDSTRFDYLEGTATDFLRRNYGGTVVASGGYSPETADRAIADGRFDGVAIGRPFIANPDYVERVRDGSTLAAYDESMLKTLS
jgi:2,4-dienoyl-CoA reductase-like NADH-dependent reductase (Old Yellow Enzyme family)